jgi:polar amino acid transport system substrate-binding protein
MNHRFTLFAAAGAVAACAALVPAQAFAGVRVCTMPGSPSAVLDRAVARAVLDTAGIAASFVTRGIDDDGGDDGISAHDLVKTLGRRCDLLVGLPRSSVADGSDSALLFSRGYLRAGYVSVTLRDAHAAPPADGRPTIAAMWSSPAQLIALQQKHAHFDLENTSERTIEALAQGRAQRAIVWYPAVVAYRRAHPRARFDVVLAASPYADWTLVFASGPRTQALEQRIDAALARMQRDGRLASLTRGWRLPGSDNAQAARAPARAPGHALAWTAPAVPVGGGFIRVAATLGGAAPSFERGQVEHGRRLYADACAKCHGAHLEGISAPALSGPAFAPAANAHLTIGGIYQYMSTNMPADHPGKLADQDYADLMAFLLYTNGYDAGGAKLTSNAALASTTPLNAGPRR